MKKSIPWKRVLSFCLVLLLAVLGSVETAYAATIPYDTYNYDYREYIHLTPAAYVLEQTIRGENLEFNGESIGKFVSPQDLCKSSDGKVFLADTGNNRIVVLNNSMTKVLHVISTFDNDGQEDSFNQPYGVYVSEKGRLYVADSQNRRVVILEQDGTFVGVMQNPQSESLEEGYVFTPLKVSVDYADRVYVIAQNMFEGIMVFESNGEFSSFIGTIKVQISLWDKMRKRLATKQERSKQQLYIPTEFTGLDIDPGGFVYSTSIDASGEQGVRRLNPKGEDVLKKGANKHVGGDIWNTGSTEYAGPSQFTDVTYRGDGIYSCLDRKRGRIFTYDHEGNLLYIFGGLGSQEGTFSIPVAIEDLGDRIIALDGARAEIITFEVTEYGRLINEAVGLRFEGDETLAVPLWKRVLELDENNELANVGIGKAYLTAGEYKLAMKYLKLGMSSEYYSIAFRRFRNQMLAQNANYLLTGLVIFLVVWRIYKVWKNKRQGKKREGGLLNG